MSGGPDSMALCVLAANWKTFGRNESDGIDGLLAIIVDHGLRVESGEEAILVSQRVSEMGKCGNFSLLLYVRLCRFGWFKLAECLDIEV